MMIEQTILEYLDSRLDVPCYLMRPENVPDAFVLIEKTGGSRTNKVDRATLQAPVVDSPLIIEMMDTPGNQQGILIRADVQTQKKKEILSFGDKYSSKFSKNEIVESVCKTVKDDIDTFTQGAEQSDDITMLCIRYTG